MNRLKKIDCIMFYVEDLETSAKFYEEVLGLKRGWGDVDQMMVGFLFPENNSEIVIHSDKTMPNPTYNFSVEDVVKFCEEYKKLGYKVLKEPFDVRTGKFAVLADLDGNVLPIIDLTKFGGQPRFD